MEKYLLTLEELPPLDEEIFHFYFSISGGKRGIRYFLLIIFFRCWCLLVCVTLLASLRTEVNSLSLSLSLEAEANKLYFPFFHRIAFLRVVSLLSHGCLAVSSFCRAQMSVSILP